MKRMPLLVAATILGLTGGAPAVGDTVCRPTALGTSLRCSGPAVRPQPRPPYVRNRGLDQVVRPADPTDTGGRFVPARETNRLGTTVTDGPLPGACRPDRLGNTICR